MADVHTLGTGDLKKLLFEYSLPAIVAMIAASLYNIVDSIFIGQGVGALAISGLAVTFPLMNLSVAFGALVGAGGSTLLSIKMGQKDIDAAEKILGNIVMLNILLGIIFMIAVMLFLDPILTFFGASPETLPYAHQYMMIILAGNVITHLYFGLNHSLRSSGYPRKAMITTLLTVIINAILDPIFIFLFHWGIQGAAIATILSQTIALIYITIHFLNPHRQLHFKQGTFTLHTRIVRGIVSIGMAPFVLNTCACLVVIIINKALYTHGGDLAIGAYGIVNRIMMLFAMLVMGFNQGMQPIVGYNYGAQQHTRVRTTLWYTIACATTIMLFAFLIAEIIPNHIARLFTNDPQLIALSTQGMRIIMSTCPIIGFQMVVSNFFQSIGKAEKAVFLSSTRQLLFLIPLLLILPPIWGIQGIWWSMPISDTIATILTAIILLTDKNTIRKQHTKTT